MSISNEKKILMPRMCPPPNNKQGNGFLLTRTNYYSRIKQPQRNPIHHYKKQYTGNNNPNLLIDHKFDIPNQYVVNSTENCPKCVSKDALLFTQEIYPNNVRSHLSEGFQSRDPFIWKYIACCQQNNIIRPVQTNISSNYSVSMKQHRQRRGIPELKNTNINYINNKNIKIYSNCSNIQNESKCSNSEINENTNNINIDTEICRNNIGVLTQSRNRCQ